MATITTNETSIEDSIYTFYKMKNEYEETIKKEMMTLLRKTKFETDDDKRKEYKKIKQRFKPKCYACKRSGGTIFSTKLDKELSRVVSAVCGHVQEPCNLNIEINLGKYDLMKNEIDTNQEIYAQLKNSVITDKNQMLFGYKTTDDVLKHYEEIKGAISNYSVLLEMDIQNYYDVIDSSDKKDKLLRFTKKSYELIQQIKECMHQYDTTGNTQFAKDAVQIYMNELIQVLKDIMQNKYSNTFVQYDDDDKTYTLNQQFYTLSDIEENVKQPKVIKFNTTSVKKNLIKKKNYEDDDDNDGENEERDDVL